MKILGLMIIPWIIIGMIGLISFKKKKGRNLGRNLGIGGSFLEFGYSIWLWIEFNSLIGKPQFILEIGNKAIFGLDGLSLFFIILTNFLIPLCLLVDYEKILLMYKEYIILIFLTQIMILNAILSLNIIFFYIFFEGILIPMFLIIGIWGGRKEKVKAGYYFIFYTIFGSIIMLISIIYLYSYYGHIDLFFFNTQNIPHNLQIILLIGFILSFGIKIPLFPFHIWLPYAHVEAPISGSVLLAGILIKLGGYGFLRFAFPLFPFACQYLSPILIILGILGIIYGSLITLCQIDIKKIIAYSSVSHMGILILGLFSFTLNGWLGSAGGGIGSVFGRF